MRLTILFLSLGLFASCVTNYHVQTFSNNVATPTSVTIQRTDPSTEEPFEVTYEGIFKAKDLETAMQMAKEAGYTKLLSIEYGTNLVLGFIGTQWVIIRCSNE